MPAEKKRLVVDDIRTADFGAIIVRDPVAALELITKESWDEVWLDHDNSFAGTLDYSWVTYQIYRKCLNGKIPKVGMFVMHSANMKGREVMRSHLTEWFDIMDIEEYPERVRLDGVGKVISVNSWEGLEWDLFDRRFDRGPAYAR